MICDLKSRSGDLILIQDHIRSPEEGAGRLQAREVVERVQPEEVAVRLRVGQVVARDVGHGAQALVDAVLFGVVHDAPRHRLLVAKHAHVVVERGEVAVHHLCVVADSNLKK